MNRKRMQDETLNFAITCLASVFRTDDLIEVAGHPWSREERLADRFGTADQIAWKAATLVGGRFVTAAVVRPLIPCMEDLLRQERSGLGVVQATYWAGELHWNWIGKQDPCWQAVLGLAGGAPKVAASEPKEIVGSGGFYVVAVFSEDIPAAGLAAYYRFRREQLGWRFSQVDRRTVDPFSRLYSHPPYSGWRGFAQPAAST
jgi:hypothetical protein